MSARSGDLPSARDLPRACDGDDSFILLLFRETEWKGHSGEEREGERAEREREREGERERERERERDERRRVATDPYAT